MTCDLHTRRAPRVLAVTVAWIACGNPLAAQTIAGRVVDATRSEGVAFALVRVFGAVGAQLAATPADAQGRFRLEVPARDEPMRLTVETLFHLPFSVDSLRVARGQVLTLPDIVLEPDPIALGEVTVQVRRRGLVPGREWTRRNQLLGKGTFLPGAVVELAAGASLGAYIANQTRLWVRFDERGKAALHNPAGALSRCVDVLVNRWKLERTGFQSVDEIPRERIAAIEIYENERDIPPGYWFDGRPGCGLVNVWLWNSW
jgi:hypothetical protein